VKKTKTNSRYSKSLKRKISIEYLNGKFSYAVAAETYGLKNKGVVKEFVRWYKKSGYLDPMEIEKPTNVGVESSAESAQIKALEMALAMAKLKIAGLETMIDIAEQELSIVIRKKSGTKPSK
jgi:transposase-like protein